MREQWEIFTCDYCGAVYKGRKENISKNNSFLKVYKVKDVVDNHTHYQEFCGVNCCQKYISEILLSGLCTDISLDRLTISYYDERKDTDNTMRSLTDEETEIYDSWIESEAKDTGVDITGGSEDG
jgi:hypothetical protein